MKSALLAAAAVVSFLALAVPSAGQDQPVMDMTAEIRTALAALDAAHGQLGGMGGLGAIAEDDLKVIQGLLGEGERLIREARRRAQEAKTKQDEAWAIGYARAGKAMVESADDYRRANGYL